jgi:hypothetical protein
MVGAVVVNGAHFGFMSLFRELQQEWTSTASSRAARSALDRWSTDEEVFTGFVSPMEVVAAIQRRGDPERSRVLLAALLRQADDALATRAVLQAILPGLSKMPWAGSNLVGDGRRWVNLRDVDADLVACAWEEIHRRAGQTHSHPAKVLIGAVHRRLRTWREAHERCAARSTTFDWELHAPGVDLEWARPPAERLAARLVTAVAGGAISTEQARLIFATAVAGLPAAEVGRREGLAPRAIYFALSRAETNLARTCA